MAGLVARADSGAKRARDAHQFAFVTIAHRGCRIDV
jgi:hypothetical protein